MIKLTAIEYDRTKLAHSVYDEILLFHVYEDNVKIKNYEISFGILYGEPTDYMQEFIKRCLKKYAMKQIEG